MKPPCAHLDQVRGRSVTAANERVCEDCIRLGTRWHHLRICRTCGHMGCCDQSPERHARGHFRLTGHPIMQTTEPGEDWTWCFICERTYRDGPGGGFDPIDLFTEAGLQFAREHVEAGGSLPLGPDVRSTRGFPLGEWARHVNERRRADELSSADESAIAALAGWTWDGVSDRT
jgi:hypothetical protein